MMYPVNTIDATSYDCIPSHVKLFNLQSIDELLWVSLPAEAGRACMLVGLQQTLPTDLIYDIDDSSLVKENTWLCIPWELLDLDPGQHIYKIMLKDKFNTQTFALFFSYMIQTNAPDRPYVYIQRSSDETEVNI